MAQIRGIVDVLKSQFRCLFKTSGGGLQCKGEYACKIIMSYIVLHDYCRDRSIDYGIGNNRDIVIMMK